MVDSVAGRVEEQPFTALLVAGQLVAPWVSARAALTPLAGGRNGLPSRPENEEKSPEDPMSIYQLLKDDHRDVKQLLRQLDEKSTRASKSKRALFDELKQMVIAHFRAEQKVFDQGQQGRPRPRLGGLRGIMRSRRSFRDEPIVFER